MHTVDRRGVHIEQCQGCRGIFLDRGELEAITSAEQGYYGAPMGTSPPYQSHGAHGARYGDSPPPYGGAAYYGDSPPPYGHSGHHGHRRRKSFFEELFD